LIGQQNCFSDVYPAKILDLSAKPFFPCSFIFVLILSVWMLSITFILQIFYFLTVRDRCAHCCSFYFVSNYIVTRLFIFILLRFCDISSSAMRKLVVFVIAFPSFPGRGLLRFSIPRRRDSFGARKDNVSVGAYIRPDAFQREQWRDNMSRYRRLNSRARALMSQM